MCYKALGVEHQPRLDGPPEFSDSIRAGVSVRADYLNRERSERSVFLKKMTPSIGSSRFSDSLFRPLHRLLLIVSTVRELGEA